MATSLTVVQSNGDSPEAIKDRQLSELFNLCVQLYQTNALTLAHKDTLARRAEDIAASQNVFAKDLIVSLAQDETQPEKPENGQQRKIPPAQRLAQSLYKILDRNNDLGHDVFEILSTHKLPEVRAEVVKGLPMIYRHFPELATAGAKKLANDDAVEVRQAFADYPTVEPCLEEGIQFKGYESIGRTTLAYLFKSNLGLGLHIADLLKSKAREQEKYQPYFDKAEAKLPHLVFSDTPRLSSLVTELSGTCPAPEVKLYAEITAIQAAAIGNAEATLDELFGKEGEPAVPTQG